MRHDQLARFYVVAWGKAISAGTDTEGIRKEGKRLFAGAMIPAEWVQDVPDTHLPILFDSEAQGGMALFDAYEPDTEDELILYTVFPAIKPPVRFKQLYDGSTKWFRVTRDVPYGIAALRSVDGICKAGDIAYEGDIIPIQWLSALPYDAIRRLSDTGLRSLQWAQGLNNEQVKILKGMAKYPVIVTYRPTSHELETLYEQYPGTHPDFNIPILENIPDENESSEDNS